MNTALPPPSGDNEDKSEIWHRVLVTALSMPGAKIDRAAFLKKALSPYFSDEIVQKAIDTRPALAGISPNAIKSIAKSSIGWHRTGVTAASFAISIPGGWWMVGTVPTDMAQFFWHVAVVLQKLAYLYGWPSLTNNKQELDDETLSIFTLFAGVMFGANAASKVLAEISEKVAEQVLKRLPREALTKWTSFQLLKEVVKWNGIFLTKDTFAKYVSKAIPIVSGFVSGGVTWISFSLMSRRLRVHLENLRLARE